MEQAASFVTLLPPAVPPAVQGVTEQPRREYIPRTVSMNDESDSALEDEPIEPQTTRRLEDALGRRGKRWTRWAAMAMVSATRFRATRVPIFCFPVFFIDETKNQVSRNARFVPPPTPRSLRKSRCW